MLFCKIDITQKKKKKSIAEMVFNRQRKNLSINHVPNFIATTIPEEANTFLKIRDLPTVTI